MTLLGKDMLLRSLTRAARQASCSGFRLPSMALHLKNRTMTVVDQYAVLPGLRRSLCEARIVDG